jgi:hypothetical protein
MSRKLKVIAISGALGFMLAWTVLGYSCICFHWRCQFNETLALMLCPACVLAIGLDNASFAGALFGWLVIAFSNMASISASAQLSVTSSLVRGNRRTESDSLTHR